MRLSAEQAKRDRRPHQPERPSMTSGRKAEEAFSGIFLGKMGRKVLKNLKG